MKMALIFFKSATPRRRSGACGLWETTHPSIP